jgi:hypothetical protein
MKKQNVPPAPGRFAFCRSDFCLELVPEELIVDLVVVPDFRGLNVGADVDAAPQVAQLRRPILRLARSS